MKKILLSFILTSICFADLQVKIVDASSSTIPTSYTTANTSLKISGFSNMTGLIVNSHMSSAKVQVNCSTGSTTAPDDNDVNGIPVSAGEAISIDNVPFGGSCYIRSLTGSALTSGLVDIIAKRK